MPLIQIYGQAVFLCALDGVKEQGTSQTVSKSRMRGRRLKPVDCEMILMIKKY